MSATLEGRHWLAIPLRDFSSIHVIISVKLIKNIAFWPSCKALWVHACAGSSSGYWTPISGAFRDWWRTTHALCDAQSIHEGSSEARSCGIVIILHHPISTSTIPTLGEALYEVLSRYSSGDCSQVVPRRHRVGEKPAFSHFAIAASSHCWSATDSW